MNTETRPGQSRLESNNAERVDTQRGKRISFKEQRRRLKKKKRSR